MHLLLAAFICLAFLCKGQFAARAVSSQRLATFLLSSSVAIRSENAAWMREKRLLRGVVVEAIAVQERKRFALEKQMVVEADSENDEKSHAKALRRFDQITVHLAETNTTQQRLLELKANLSQRDPDLVVLRTIIEEEMGLAKRLESFDPEAASMRQWGRPDGFVGLVIESPRGVPILVSRGKFNDPLLRRVARGNDLWFQVQDSERKESDSRVLLRTSMVPMFKRSPRECQEMAADLAALFSQQWKRAKLDEIEVMFTDSKRVAKRGGRVGQMKASKKLGTLWARPDRVKDVARKALEDQGLL